MVLGIAIFVSGKGTNAKNIIKYFKGKKQKYTFYILSTINNSQLSHFSKNNNLSYYEFNNQNELFDHAVSLQNNKKVSHIVLAGFLKKIPKELIAIYKNKIINIHPALLPKYGGKGMYGMNVHKAVFNNKDKESGITIHYVNENYDEGQVIFQKSCDIRHCKSPEEIAKDVLILEHKYYPLIIEDLLSKSH